MGRYLRFISLVGCLLFSASLSFAKKRLDGTSKKDTLTQENPPKLQKLYTLSGLGLPFTAGSVADQLQPALSTKLGFQLSLGEKGFFLYPSVNFLVFNYDQLRTGDTFIFTVKDARSTLTSLTFSAGKRHKIGIFTLYEFGGLGGALVKEPRISVETITGTAKIVNETKPTLNATAGIGLEYQIGEFVLLVEGAYLYNFKKLQGERNFMFPVFIGFKSNISSLLDLL